MRFLQIAFLTTATAFTAITVSAQTRSTSAVPPPFFKGVPSGTVSSTPLSLTILDAINRALTQNLGVLNAEHSVDQAKGKHWTALSELLPTADARLTESRPLVNLAAFGFNPQQFGFPSVVGPFNLFDARVDVTHTSIGVHSMNLCHAEDYDSAA